MTTRRFGPTSGAGVVVIEKEAEKLLQPAPLGVTGHSGIYQWGSTAKLNSTFSKKDMIRKLGAIIDESDASQSAHDFWDMSAGAGELHAIRITDGNGIQSEAIFYNRKDPKAQAMKIKGAYVGRRAGRGKVIAGEVPTGMGTDLTETTIDTGLTMKTDEWAGGFVILDDVPAKAYPIVSNTAAGVVTVRGDSTMKTDYGSGTDDGFVLRLDPNSIGIAVFIGASESPDDVDSFSLTVFADGEVVRKYPILSIDPDSRYYFVNIINDDTSNHEIRAEDLITVPTPDVAEALPANHHGTIGTVTETVLTSTLFQQRVSSPTGANPTVTLGTTSDLMKFHDVLVCTVLAGAATFDAVSTYVAPGVKVVSAGSIGSLVTPITPILPPFTITNGGTVLAQDDIVYIDYFPFMPDALIGGYVIPDWENSPLTRFLIIDNDHKSLTVGAGQDMTSVATAGDKFVVEVPTELRGGNDGIADIVDGDYSPAWDIASSLFNTLFGQNKGLVKLGMPGKTATAIVKEMAAYAEAKNWQCRYEIPSGTTDEAGAIAQINSTYGRNDMAVTILPSFAYIDDPNRSGTKKLVSLTGQIHGREARVAKNFDGYHKAAAGVDVVLSKVLELPAEDLNEEILNPQGINVVKFVKGNAIIWGDRTVSIDPAWKWKHQRELMSHYENQLRESFDFIIFAINDKTAQALLFTSLRAFFQPEFAKGAVRGDKFEDAVQIKIDSDINTDATRAAGDLNAEIILRLADTIERFIIIVGKKGVFESVA